MRLIAVHGLADGRTVDFILAEELIVDGKVLARAGDIASGQVGQVNRAQVSGEAISVTLERVMLRAGNVNVPLRSSQARGGAGPQQCRKLPESGKIELTGARCPVFQSASIFSRKAPNNASSNFLIRIFGVLVQQIEDGQAVQVQCSVHVIR